MTEDDIERAVKCKAKTVARDFVDPERCRQCLLKKICWGRE